MDVVIPQIPAARNSRIKNKAHKHLQKLILRIFELKSKSTMSSALFELPCLVNASSTESTAYGAPPAAEAEILKQRIFYLYGSFSTSSFISEKSWLDVNRGVY